MNTPKHLRFIPHVMVKCKCGQWVIIGEQVDPNNCRHYGVLHPVPQCELFIKTEITDYVRTLRKIYEAN